MIDFRYHVVSIVAVFLALALGLFVGSTSLQDVVVHSLKSNTDRVARENAALRTQLDQSQALLKAEQSFDKALLPYAVSGRLSGQLVTLVSAPGASDGLRKQLVTALQAAGATVSLDVRLQRTFVDPKQDAFIGALADHVTVPGATATGGTSGAVRAARQLAAVLGERPSSHSVSPSTLDTVLSTYSQAKLVTVAKTTVTRPGTLAIVLAGPAPGPTSIPTQVEAEQTLLLTLLRDLDVTALGAVLAAPTAPPGSAPDVVASAAGAGSLTRAASTVSGADTTAGQIATVIALAAQVDGVAGQFGPGQVAPLPVPSAAP